MTAAPSLARIKELHAIAVEAAPLLWLRRRVVGSRVPGRPGRMATRAGFLTESCRRRARPLHEFSQVRMVLPSRVCQISLASWSWNVKDMCRSHASQAESMRTAHQTAAHSRWLAAEIQEALDDPRPRLPLDEVMAAMEAEIDAVARESAADRYPPESLVPSLGPRRQ